MGTVYEVFSQSPAKIGQQIICNAQEFISHFRTPELISKVKHYRIYWIIYQERVQKQIFH